MSFLFSFLFKSSWSPAFIFAGVQAMVLILRIRPGRIPWKTLAGGLCAVCVAGACIYLFLPTLQDDIEAGIASVTALTLHGWPMYPAPDAIDRYIVAYGPLTYAARIPAMVLFGSNLFAFKLTGVLAFLASLIGIYRICRHYAPSGAALVGLGCCCLMFFRFLPLPFSGRGDVFLLCMTILTIWAALEAPGWVALLTAAAAFALAPNIKITAGAYLFPVVWALVIRKGWKIAAGALSLGLVLFCLPFLSPQVSLANYWFSLNNSRHTLRTDILLRNLQYSAILLIPILAALAHRRKIRLPLSREQWVYFALILCSITTASFVGANFGSGPHHLAPCIVPILDFYFWLESEAPFEAHVWSFSKFAIAWTVSMLVFSAVNVSVFRLTLGNLRGERQAFAEVRAMEAAHRGLPVQVGIGRDFNDFRTVYGALTTLDGQPYTIGGLAVRELQVAGVEIPDSTVGYVERCGTAIWLIPKGDAPFSAPDPYFGPNHPAFSERFRMAFLQHYQKTGSGALYDVWSCSVTRTD